MVLEILTQILTQAAQLNNVLALGVLFVLIVVAYHFLKVAVKALMTGFLAALVPVASFALGLNIVPLDLTTMMMFAVLGVSTYLLYSSVSTGFKVLKFVTKPVGFLFRSGPKQKVIVQQVEKKED